MTIFAPWSIRGAEQDKGKRRSARPRHSVGRWSILHAGEAPERDRTLEAMCWTLLRRYGVVFREILARESMVPRWRDLLITYRRLEDRGEIRGGRFVSGFLGEQFALPIAIESLRATSKQPRDGEVVTISAADPLNLVGIVVPGERVPPSSLKNIAFRDGVPVTAESRNAQAGSDNLAHVLAAQPGMQSPQRRARASAGLAE